MTKSMRIELYFSGGGYIEKELAYTGNDMQEIAKRIENDENALLEYLMTGEENGAGAFCFCGFVVRKNGIVAGMFSEAFEF